jgi:hypothetical protein
MLVYREQRREARPAAMLAGARTALDDLSIASPDRHDRIVRLLIEFGQLESAVADSLSPEADAPHPLIGLLRAASVAAGHMIWHSWRGRPDAIAPWIGRARAALDAAECRTLPDTVTVTVPEGFAQYGLFPEIYLVSATKAARAHPMPRVVCVGIRSIGTALSAIVTAAHEELGREVLSLTVRPHGHPFNRRPRFSEALAGLLRECRSSLFLLVDEGPGLSGSSLAGTARALVELGVEEDRLVLLPSWRTDGSSLGSAEARWRWSRHAQFTATFEEVWIDSGRLGHAVAGRELQDLSAGAWRAALLEPQRPLPAVQPQHERRKYLARAREAPAERVPHLMMRFAGLGALGEPRRARAEALADAGFGARVVGLVHGFLLQEFLPGSPARITDAAELARTIAAFLAHLRRRLPAGEPATDLRQMVVTNVGEALGPEAADQALARLEASSLDVVPTALDGRMLPHEWVRTPAGFRKVDAVDHGDDHFYPGPQDIAWDVAGTCLEFDFPPQLRRAFLAEYCCASGDRTIARRLPGFAVAYLAFRAGYTSLAGDQLGASGDGARFRAQASAYRARLARELATSGEASWTS